MTRDRLHDRSLRKCATYKRPAAKSIHISVHLITLSDEKSGTILLNSLKNGFQRK